MKIDNLKIVKSLDATESSLVIGGVEISGNNGRTEKEKYLHQMDVFGRNLKKMLETQGYDKAKAKGILYQSIVDRRFADLLA